MTKAVYLKHRLEFLVPSGTSRGVLKSKDSWFVILHDGERGTTGIGECSLIPGLSPDPLDRFEEILGSCCHRFEISGDIEGPELNEFPAIRFGFETAERDLRSGGSRILFKSEFTRGKSGIPINGLIWMGKKDEMLRQVSRKIEEGFRVLKLKVGAIEFQDELDILKHIRTTFTGRDLQIRVDANGAWTAEEALERMKRLSEFVLHSIEQPIPAGNWQEMAALCEKSPLAVALDEELIGIYRAQSKRELLETIRPRFIILKPTLLGGLKASEDWISHAEKTGTGWWITSALESNIALNAIAQWTYSTGNRMYQGLGTGQIFKNNIASPLEVIEGKLWYQPGKNWNLSPLKL